MLAQVGVCLLYKSPVSGTLFVLVGGHLIAQGTEPVSYTHLDVYKRQDRHSADLKCHAQTAQQANHIFALEQDFKTQIRHSAASFPASCPAGTCLLYTSVPEMTII